MSKNYTTDLFVNQLSLNQSIIFKILRRMLKILEKNRKSFNLTKKPWNCELTIYFESDIIFIYYFKSMKTPKLWVGN